MTKLPIKSEEVLAAIFPEVGRAVEWGGRPARARRVPVLWRQGQPGEV